MDPSKQRSQVLARLAEVATAQEGYFSAAQATAADVDRHRLQRLVGQGILERDDRGIYRFAAYPHGERNELWRAVLWPSVKRGDVTGVISYGTALSLYDVSTINPAGLDITLPRATRFRRKIPPVYRVRFEDLEETDITRLYGLPVTTLFRTLTDLIVRGEDRQFVMEALDDAPRRGMLTQSEGQQLAALAALDQNLIQKLTAS